MGQALKSLKDEGFLIVGSGSSCHGEFRQEASIEKSAEFDKELTRQIVESKS